MTTSQTSTIIEREVHIDASPETVYRFFIDPEQFVRWMGRKAEIDARPGGLLRLDYNGFDIMRGSIVEFEENRRVVITWGFETLGDAPAPGSTRVEMTLTPEAGGTRLRLVHSGLDEASAEAHRGGWDHFLEMLRQQAAGAPAPEPVTLSESEEMASKLNTLLVNVRWAIESCPANRWTTPTPNDGRQVNQVANHIVGHLFLADFAAATARGERAPAADFTGEMLEGFNAQAAKEAAGVTPGRGAGGAQTGRAEGGRDREGADGRRAGPDAADAVRGRRRAERAADRAGSAARRHRGTPGVDAGGQLAHPGVSDR